MTKKKVHYVEHLAAFDIETSSYEDEGVKKAIVYSYALAIDDTIYRARRADEFFSLLEKIAADMELSLDRRLVVYVHNEAYEWQFIKHYMQWDSAFAIASERRVVRAVSTLGFEFRCSYVLTNKPLEAVATPELVGVKSNSLPLGKLSGRHAFVEKLRDLALDFTDEDIKPLFAKFKALADKKQEITDADIRALVAGTMVENPEGFHFDDLQLQTHAENDIEATVRLANLDGEKVEFNASGQGSVEAIFNAIDKFFNQYVRLVSYTIDAVTDGIDAQARVLVTVENRDTETIFNAAGLDFDVLKASAIAYINANTFVQKENTGEIGPNISYRDMPSV